MGISALQGGPHAGSIVPLTVRTLAPSLALEQRQQLCHRRRWSVINAHASRVQKPPSDAHHFGAPSRSTNRSQVRSATFLSLRSAEDGNRAPSADAIYQRGFYTARASTSRPSQSELAAARHAGCGATDGARRAARAHRPSRSAFLTDRAFPSAVRGPVDRSHGRQRRIAAACRHLNGRSCGMSCPPDGDVAFAVAVVEAKLTRAAAAPSDRCATRATQA